MRDPIERSDAIDAIEKAKTAQSPDGEIYVSKINAQMNIQILPSAEPEEFEWCTGCKEYDQKAHCCHRWTKVIRNTVEELKSAEPEWIPIKTRPMDEEERVYYTDIYGWELTDEDALIFDCQMPEDGQEIWICSKCGNVWIDTCEVEDGIGLEGNGDWADIVAWMPHYKPEPWKGEKMPEYHVGCGAFDIYAGTLEKGGKLWKNKSPVTEEALSAAAEYLLMEKKEFQFSVRGEEYIMRVVKESWKEFMNPPEGSEE